MAIKSPQRNRASPISLRITRSLEETLEKMENSQEPAEILAAVTPHAAKVLAVNLTSKNDLVRDKAAKEILDRVMGRPVERQVSINAHVYSLNSTEVNNELDRLLEKFGTNIIEGIAQTNALARAQTTIDITPESGATEGLKES